MTMPNKNYIYVRATKSYRNGEDTVVVPVSKRIYAGYSEEEMIKEAVENWAENDSAGQVYGYTVDYELETDVPIIAKKITSMIENKKAYLKSLKAEIKELKEDLGTL